MKIRSLIAVGIATALSYLPAQATQLRMLSSFDPNFVFTTEVATPFMKNVEAASGGDITFVLNGPEVVPTFEQMQPVSAGVFDLLFTHAAYHTGSTAIGVAMDAVTTDPAKRRETGLWDFVDEHYKTKHGLKLIAIPPLGSKGFHFILTKPIEGSPALNGRKIRGSVTYHNIIKGLGGSPVLLPGGEVYSAMEKGVVDGAAWSLNGVLDFKWYEVAKYMSRPIFGQSNLYIFMSLAKWNSLTPEQQKVLLEEGKKLETSVIPKLDALAQEEFEALKEKGMQETNFAPEDAKQLDALMAKGIWDLARDKSKVEAEEMYELAKKNGLTP